MGLISRKTEWPEIILGGQDGVVNVLGIVIGLSAAGSLSRFIIAGGLAATFAESVSMGAVVFTSRSNERDEYSGVKARLQRRIKASPAKARADLEAIFSGKGLKGNALASAIDSITTDNQLWLDTLMAEGTELAFATRRQIVWQSFVTFLAALTGSFVPLIPYFFIADTHTALIYSLLASAVVLFTVGAYSTYRHVRKPLRGGLQLMLIGMTAALIGYLIGILFKV